MPVEVGAPIAAAVWMLLAWANARWHRWVRAGVVAMLVLSSVSLVAAIGRHAATYAPADVIAALAVCVSAVAATALIIGTASGRHAGDVTSP